MSQASNPEHISSSLQVSGCSYKDITRVSSATEKSETDVKRRVAEWDHRAYMPYVKCTVVLSVRLLGRINTVHKPQRKMKTSLELISDTLSVAQEPDVGKIIWTCGRVCICLTWCHISTCRGHQPREPVICSSQTPTSSVRVDTSWVKCGLISVPANLLFNQWVSSCWIVPCYTHTHTHTHTHTVTHIVLFTLKVVTPVCTEMLEQLWHVTCLNLKSCYVAQWMRRYVCWLWPLTTSLVFFVMCPFLYMNCCFIILVHTCMRQLKSPSCSCSCLLLILCFLCICRGEYKCSDLSASHSYNSSVCVLCKETWKKKPHYFKVCWKSCCWSVLLAQMTSTHLLIQLLILSV
jgi:hypothetical protein